MSAQPDQNSKEMVRRAAIAFDRLSGDAEGAPHSGTLEGMRAALIAALDPEDEALVARVAAGIAKNDGGEGPYYLPEARAAIVALRALAQGASVE